MHHIYTPIITLFFIIVIAFLETILANCVSVYIINSKLPKPLLSSEYNNTIWKILGCCFLAESISMVILSILFPVILGESIKYAVQNSVILLIYMITTGTNYSNLQSILFTISTIFLSSVIIFLLCRFFIFKNLDLLEELIKQNKVYAKFNPESVNCLRIVTVIKDEKVFPIYCMFKIGNNDFRDNYHNGGICCMVDMATGKIITNGKSSKEYNNKASNN